MTLAIVNVLPEPVTPEQHLVFLAVKYPARERLDGRSLVALRLVTGNEFEIH